MCSSDLTPQPAAAPPARKSSKLLLAIMLALIGVLLFLTLYKFIEIPFVDTERAARLAQLTVRAASVWLQPPAYHAGKAPIELRVVHAREQDPPPEREAVQWLLLTTLPVATAVSVGPS